MSSQGKPPADHYKTLGVGSAATPSELKKAYRNRARKVRPSAADEYNSKERAHLASLLPLTLLLCRATPDTRHPPLSLPSHHPSRSARAHAPRTLTPPSHTLTPPSHSL